MVLVIVELVAADLVDVAVVFFVWRIELFIASVEDVFEIIELFLFFVGLWLFLFFLRYDDHWISVVNFHAHLLLAVFLEHKGFDLGLHIVSDLSFAWISCPSSPLRSCSFSIAILSA